LKKGAGTPYWRVPSQKRPELIAVYASKETSNLTDVVFKF